MEETKYSEIIKGYTYEQLVYERAILEKNNPSDTYITLSNLSNTPPCPGIKFE